MKFVRMFVLSLGCAVFTLHAAETGVTDQEITVGQFAAFSGAAGQLGQRMRAGIEAHFKSVNSSGGINGRRLKLVTRDDGYEPEKAKVAVRALIEEDKVFALIGSVGTPTGLAAVPILTEAKVPIVGMFTGAQALREPFNRNVFHVRARAFHDGDGDVSGFAAHNGHVTPDETVADYRDDERLRPGGNAGDLEAAIGVGEGLLSGGLDFDQHGGQGCAGPRFDDGAGDAADSRLPGSVRWK